MLNAKEKQRRKPKAKKSRKPAAKKVMPKPSAAAPKEPGQKGVNTPSRVDIFVAEYLVDLNGRHAAIRAGYSPLSARQTAAELLATEPVQAAVRLAMDERAKRTGITVDRVLERLWGIATADPRALVEMYRCCCRFCWGDKHMYQYTPREMAAARVLFESDGGDPCKFDEGGGANYNPRMDPNPACPECFGAGVERVYPKDTRDLPPNAQLLFAGIKTTRHGIEIKTHDQKAALVDIGKHLGLFRERLELTGKDGKDLGAGVVIVPAKQVANDDVEDLPGASAKAAKLRKLRKSQPKAKTKPKPKQFAVRAKA